MDRQLRRREVLALTTGFGTVALAGCSGDGGDGSGEGNDGTANPTDAEETATATGTRTGTATDTATTTTDDGTETRGPTATDAGTETATRTATDTRTATPTDTETAASGRLEVAVEGFAFAPVRARVTPGTTVEWTNNDRAPHTIVATKYHDVAADWDFDERLPGGANATTEYTFEDPGIYQYLCDVHGRQTMCGAVLVGDVSLDQSMPCE